MALLELAIADRKSPDHQGLGQCQYFFNGGGQCAAYIKPFVYTSSPSHRLSVKYHLILILYGVVMDLGLQGKRALVTGGSRGIGAAIAQALSAEGVQVAVVARTASDINKVIDQMGGRSKGHAGIAM